MNKLTLDINLSNDLFSPLGRRKYTTKYTTVPVTAYPEAVKEVMENFYKLLNLELTDSTASIAVVSSEQGFPQAVSGPKVYQVDGVLSVKVGPGLYPFTTEVIEDEQVLKLFGKKATLLSDGEKPVIRVTLNANQAIKLPVFVKYNEDSQSYYNFSDVESALGNETAISNVVGEVKSNTEGGLIFSDLKRLPVERYLVHSAKMAVGKYGDVLAMVLSSKEDLTFETYTSNDNVWTLTETLVPAGSKIKVNGNTALKRSLMGTTLVLEDNVYLDITGSRLTKEDKLIVEASFDYEDSRLKFEF
jgi:hypothetical protein